MSSTDPRHSLWVSPVIQSPILPQPSSPLTLSLPDWASLLSSSVLIILQAGQQWSCLSLVAFPVSYLLIYYESECVWREREGKKEIDLLKKKKNRQKQIIFYKIENLIHPRNIALQIEYVSMHVYIDRSSKSLLFHFCIFKLIAGSPTHTQHLAHNMYSINSSWVNYIGKNT